MYERPYKRRSRCWSQGSNSWAALPNLHTVYHVCQLERFGDSQLSQRIKNPRNTRHVRSGHPLSHQRYATYTTGKYLPLGNAKWYLQCNCVLASSCGNSLFSIGGISVQLSARCPSIPRGLATLALSSSSEIYPPTPLHTSQLGLHNITDFANWPSGPAENSPPGHPPPLQR